MLKSRIQCQSRKFHVLSIVNSQIKTKLRRFEEHGTLKRKTGRELLNYEQKKRNKLKKLQKTAYPKDQALHILRKNYSLSKVKNLEPFRIGPTSQSDLKFLSLTKDKRLLYTILGVNGEQLRDAHLINNDVKKFLQRGQIEKAIFLTRIAKHRGSAGMNTIMEYYLHTLKQAQTAWELYNWRKKWGIPLNEYSNTILFKGLAEQENRISSKTGNSILKIIEQKRDSGELNQIEFNAALGALSNCIDITNVFKLYEMKIDGIRRDSITFLWMLRACSRVKAENLFVELINGLLKKIPPRVIDEKLLFEFCKALHSKKEFKDIKKSTLYALNEYFELPEELVIKRKPSEMIKLQPLSHWNIAERYPLNRHVVGLFVEACMEQKEYRMIINWWLQLISGPNENRNKLLDLPIIHIVMEALIQGHPTTCANECLQAFEIVKMLPSIPASRHTLKLMYKSFEKQAIRSYTNKEEERANELLKLCQGFITNSEARYSEKFKGKVYPKQVWQYLFPIIRNVNVYGLLTKQNTMAILTEFLKTLIIGDFTQYDDTEKIKSKQKFLYLEASRFIFAIFGGIKIPDYNSEKQAYTKEENDLFQLRRLLLKLRATLLEFVEHLEKENITSSHSREVANKLSHRIDDLARTIYTKLVASKA
ncbi:Mrx1p NDAI_0A03140 [Naumovozyma dairenensis CBS 421]|uniref:Uncharacterized protein n=1 Tax=Naumovozyma dairenensis (strain ATCC 10597 / BCRC 20456 / CBS 421 / NBRC 0211 / NRRL Y-12639) TaxID=1071378 RepID=G0W3T3_NAUDC|nr:hypothetical protein NDAI_0A03140 [Naumovozyma dairenensis CBS 421]CCD22471.1 hypothetical protein NDAI_0A03140 [Naumovozyma dairenensis CBS 421]